MQFQNRKISAFCEDGSFLKEMVKKALHTLKTPETDRLKPDIHTRMRGAGRETKIQLIFLYDSCIDTHICTYTHTI